MTDNIFNRGLTRTFRSKISLPSEYEEFCLNIFTKTLVICKTSHGTILFCVQWDYFDQLISFQPVKIFKDYFLPIRSLGSHLECQAKSQHTILEGDHQRNLISKFGAIRPSGSWEEDQNMKSKITDNEHQVMGKAHMIHWI